MNIYLGLYLLLIYFMLILMISLMMMEKIDPLSMTIIVGVYVAIICFKMNYFNLSYMFSYVMYLMLIGGLLILFVYFTSLSNNMTLIFFTNNKLTNFLIIMMILMIYFMYNMDWIMETLLYEGIYEDFFSLINQSNSWMVYLDLMLQYSVDMCLYMIFYLLMTMISCVQICKLHKHPLRKLNN